MITVTRTKIPGLLIFKPHVYPDNRGVFFESFRVRDYRELGIKDDLVQDNVSCSHRNVLRGLHVRKTKGQLLTPLLGEIFDVVVDVRPDSPTYKQFETFELSGEDPLQIYMPAGTAHGFCVLSATALLHYKCSGYYDPKAESGIAWNDPSIGIPWPIQDPILSERDQRFEYLGSDVSHHKGGGES
jgi:dTDP-4-dehydrorhamnose 3,5-epimerase